jgi:hypothetical protein
LTCNCTPRPDPNFPRSYSQGLRKVSSRVRVASFAPIIAPAGGGHEKADSQITLSGSADLLNVSRASVQEAKTVLTRGTPDEILALDYLSFASGLNPAKSENWFGGNGSTAISPATLRAASMRKN